MAGENKGGVFKLVFSHEALNKGGVFRITLVKQSANEGGVFKVEISGKTKKQIKARRRF